MKELIENMMEHLSAIRAKFDENRYDEYVITGQQMFELLDMLETSYQLGLALALENEELKEEIKHPKATSQQPRIKLKYTPFMRELADLSSHQSAPIVGSSRPMKPTIIHDVEDGQ